MEFIKEILNKDLSGIYKITQLSSGKTYIGQTKMRFIKRYWHHRWKLNNNSHDNKYLQNSWNKYGQDDFEFEVIHILNKHDDMNILEVKYIEDYDSYNNGFNLTTGGEGKKDCPMSEEGKRVIGDKNRIHNLGKKHSEETKAKMRESSPHRKLTKEQSEKLIQSRKGSKHTDETKEKMRNAKLGVSELVDEIQVFEIKQRLTNGERNIDISNDLDISYGIIRSIVSERAWSHIKVDGWNDFIIKRKNENKKSPPLSREQVISVRELLSEGLNMQQVADKLKIKHSVVSNIKYNRSYKDVR